MNKQLMKNKKYEKEENPEKKLEKLTSGKKFLERKNPYKEEKFYNAVKEFSRNGINQANFSKELEDFTNSNEAMFLRDKHEQLMNVKFSCAHGHGSDHSYRVAILAMMIGRNEGIFRENSDREREILVEAAYYHDIGRIISIGPHGKRGAKLSDKREMNNLEGKQFNKVDRNLVKLLIEGHEGNDQKIEELYEKYEIAEQDKEMARKLLFVLKDADALDRARSTINIDIPIFSKEPKVITDLNPNYLRFDYSKSLMEFSYGLEYVSANMKNHFEEILNFRNNQRGKHYIPLS